ncbi:DNA replication and repair protein RecF [Marinobacter segnicrescens]|uniref:DNA replication and repair protein RecF n=1 Tax=Marinobacter segnicrescens TaxID=430453 RepID=A0A1I0DKC0_9GAMM|nr:DNA replication/repair protein RecF [Marinobacter segnicrescens]SET32600.1 DNA replication and repair protein RecF [Marinobacter segnicrescens]
MALLSLQTENFRNLAPGPFKFSPWVNLIYGANGSGKTSLLEAIAYLGLGRSFRQNRHQVVCREGQQRFVVFGAVSERSVPAVVEPGRADTATSARLGFSRDIQSRETRLRVDGENVYSLSVLASLFPVSVIDPGVFDIVAGGPGKRRQFLDWLVFHVEPSFAPLWQQCQRTISQRNQILRSGRIDDHQLQVWDRQFVELAQQVDELRLRVFSELATHLRSVLEQVHGEWAAALKVEYSPGWDRKKGLATTLIEHREQERKVGHTLYGPNRADIRLRYHGHAVAELFSRGQQKTLVILMKLSQGEVLATRGKQVTFLLDDINAELDLVHRRLLAERLNRLGSQVFMTAIERPDPSLLWEVPPSDYKMFHVEHGRLTEEQTSASGASE